MVLTPRQQHAIDIHTLGAGHNGNVDLIGLPVQTIRTLHPVLRLYRLSGVSAFVHTAAQLIRHPEHTIL